MLSPVGAVSCRGCGPCEDDRGRAGLQHPPVRQLPGVPAEEELAEREGALHQEHHGKAPASLLEHCGSRCFSTNKKQKRGRIQLDSVLLDSCIHKHSLRMVNIRHILLVRSASRQACAECILLLPPFLMATLLQKYYNIQAVNFQKLLSRSSYSTV